VKNAVEGLTKAVAVEYAKQNIWRSYFEGEAIPD